MTAPMEIIDYVEFRLILIVTCRPTTNKMELLWKRIKTEQSHHSLPLSHPKSTSRHSTGKLNTTLSSSKIRSATPNHRLTGSQRVVREENIRLVAKLIEIRTRKPKESSPQQLFPPRRKEKMMRNRQINCENQRLGRSILQIKTGKSVERIKMQIAKSQADLRKKRTAQTRCHTAQNDPQNESAIGLLSKREGFPQQLTWARLTQGGQVLELKRM